MYILNGTMTGFSMPTFNCIDRHVSKDPDKIAILWEGDDPSISKKISYTKNY